MTVATATAYKTAELVPLFARMLELCKLQAGESLVILMEPESNQEYAAAMYGAVRGIGAESVTLMVPSAPPGAGPGDPHRKRVLGDPQRLAAGG